MKAIVAAAGVGSRFKRRLGSKPKCCIEVGQEAILERLVRQLGQRNISDITVIAGYESSVVVDLLGRDSGIKFYFNPFYSITNSIDSVWFARGELDGQDDVILMNGDLFFEDRVLDSVLACREPVAMFADPRRRLDADYRLGYEKGLLTCHGKELSVEETTGEYIGVARVDRTQAPTVARHLDAMVQAQKHTLWWENVLFDLDTLGLLSIHVEEITDAFWCELDGIEDYERVQAFGSHPLTMGLALERCTDAATWDAFVETSAEGSVYCTTRLLAALQDEFELYFVTDDGRPMLAAPLQVRDGGPRFVPFEPYTTFRFALYLGPMFSREVAEQPSHRSVPLKLKLLDHLIAELTARHPRLSWVLHPQLSDIRSFLWFNYHRAEAGRFQVDVRYTGVIDLQTATADEYYRSVRQVRRQESLRAERAGICCELSDEVDVLDRLEERVFERQSLSTSTEEQVARRAVIQSALQHGYGRYLVARTADGQVASAYLFLFDRRGAYYTFAGNDPELRRTGASTYLMFQALDQFRQEGREFVDLMGLNSPLRGDFKASFNARPVPHYLVTWSPPVP